MCPIPLSAARSKDLRMTGVGLIFLILFIIGLLSLLYFAAWCMCSVQRNSKEGHYILDSEDELHDVYDKKLYSGLGKNTIETSNFIPVKSA